MNSIMIASSVAVVLAGIQYYFARQNAKDSSPPALENTFYTFAASFGLVYIILYAIEDERSAALKEMEVGEPNF